MLSAQTIELVKFFSSPSKQNKASEIRFFRTAVQLRLPLASNFVFDNSSRQSQVYFVYRHCRSKHIGLLDVWVWKPDAPQAPRTLCLCGLCGGKIVKVRREKKRGQEERVRQRKKSELNEVDEQHMNCSWGIKEGSVKRTKVKLTRWE